MGTGEQMLMRGKIAVAVIASGIPSLAHADLAISSKATQNLSCSSGVCTATAQNAVLNVGDLASLLASGDVAVKTGGGATNIVVKAGFGWTNNSRLTLDANQSVEIDKPVSVTGSGGVTITTNDGGSAGDLMFDSKGNVKFWDTSSSLIINGASFTLVNDIATLAADIATSPSGNYALANSYDASVDGTYAHSPVPTAFGGVLEGLGHTISNLQVQVPYKEDVGLFATIASTGAANDISLIHVRVGGGKTASVGGLVGTNAGQLFGDYVAGKIRQTGNGGFLGLLAGSNQGKVSHCHSAGTVDSTAYNGSAGGLVGENASSIEHSYSEAAVAGEGFSGGLVGESAGGSIVSSYATGSVNGSNSATSGGLLGRSCCIAGTSIVNSHATGTVTGDTAGGLIGQLQEPSDNVEHSHASGTVQLAYLGAGLVGRVDSESATISNSFATGDVTSQAFGGGLVGLNVGMIVVSHADADVMVTAGGAVAGGLVARNNGTIDRSFASGNVTSTADAVSSFVGGLAGENWRDAPPQATISNSYAMGQVVGQAESAAAGGLIGHVEAHSATNASYATGEVSATLVAGGFIGFNRFVPAATSSYWDITTSGQSKGAGHGNEEGFTGLTDAQLKSGLPAGFDPNIWGQSASINNGYPYLLANPPPQ